MDYLRQITRVEWLLDEVLIVRNNAVLPPGVFRVSGYE